MASGSRRVLLLCSVACFVSAAGTKESPDINIMCRASDDCILPCNFLSDGKGARVMWYKKKAVVSCTRYGNTSFVVGHNSPAEKYVGRTGLFADQVLEGNATLVLRNVTPNDQGRYICVTMTAQRKDGDESGVIALFVEAPVQDVEMRFGNNSVTCSAAGVFPAPTVTWATDPPHDIRLNKTNSEKDKYGFYSIQSSLRLRRNFTMDLRFICRVATGAGQRTASLQYEASVTAPVGGDVSIPCRLPGDLADDFNVTWRFGLSDSVVAISRGRGRSPRVKVWDSWESHVLSNFSLSNQLHLHGLTFEHQGNFTCQVRTPDRTYVTWTDVEVTADHYQYTYIFIIIGLAILLILSYVALGVLGYRVVQLERRLQDPSQGSRLVGVSSSSTTESAASESSDNRSTGDASESTAEGVSQSSDAAKENSAEKKNTKESVNSPQ